MIWPTRVWWRPTSSPISLRVRPSFWAWAKALRRALLAALDSRSNCFWAARTVLRALAFSCGIAETLLPAAGCDLDVTQTHRNRAESPARRRNVDSARDRRLGSAPGNTRHRAEHRGMRPTGFEP